LKERELSTSDTESVVTMIVSAISQLHTSPPVLAANAVSTIYLLVVLGNTSVGELNGRTQAMLPTIQTVLNGSQPDVLKEKPCTPVIRRLVN